MDLPPHADIPLLAECGQNVLLCATRQWIRHGGFRSIRSLQAAINQYFDQFSAAQSRFNRRLIYGGHAISLARALSFNGLANAFHIAAINGGRHVAPLFAGLTVFAWTEVLAASELPGRNDVGALRLRTVATKDRPCADFPYKHALGAAEGRTRGSGDEYDPAVLLDLDYWVLMPR